MTFRELYARSRPRARTVSLILVLVVCVVAYGEVGAVADVQTVESVLILILFASATNLLLGLGGMMSFGQSVFYSLGAYTVAIGITRFNIPFWEIFLLSPVAGAASAIVVGMIALRTQRWFFALVTLAFAQLAYVIIEQWYSLTQGNTGVFGVTLPGQLSSVRGGYFFVLAVTLLGLVIIGLIRHSRFGLVLSAIRDNPQRASTLGINVYLHRLLAFALSGALCAIAGTLFVVANQAAYPTLANWLQAGTPVLACVIGGPMFFAGPIVGAVILGLGQQVSEQYTSHWEVILGALLLATVLWYPDGLCNIPAPRWLIALSRPRRRQAIEQASVQEAAEG